MTPLRVGVMLRELRQPRWVLWLIDRMVSDGTTVLVCMIQCEPPASDATPSSRRRAFAGSYSRPAYALYSRIDTMIQSRRLARPDPTQLIDLTSRVAGAKLLRASIVGDLTGWRLSEPDLATIRAEELDVILDVAAHTWSGGILSVARFGLWSYGWGSRTEGCQETGLFWAAYDSRPTAAVLLNALTPSTRRMIGRREVPAHPRSLYLTRRRASAAAVSVTRHCLRLLQQRATEGAGEQQALDALSGHCGAEGGNGTEVRQSVPTHAPIVRFLHRVLLRWLRFRWQSRHGECWFLALRRRGPDHGAAKEPDDRLAGFTPLPSPPGHSRADPFLLMDDGVTHMFFEDLEPRRGKGVIAHCRLATDGTLSPATPVLERPYHLSYPFVFRWNNGLYMLPETGGNQTIELYRCVDFPGRWTFEKVLLKGRAARDTTLHQSEDGRWWMFTAIDELGEDNLALHLFHAETPLGPWQPHPANPVQTDLRYTRPAGRLFHRGGKLVRPAQDHSLRYGGAIWLMGVLELTESAYREQPCLRLGPEWLPGNHCLHHIDATGQWEIIDGMRLEPCRT